MPYYQNMEMHEYEARWGVVKVQFDNWFNGQDWAEQKKYLGRRIQKEFGLSQPKINNVFKIFDDLFSPMESCPFRWEQYQIPVLMVIVYKTAYAKEV